MLPEDKIAAPVGCGVGGVGEDASFPAGAGDEGRVGRSGPSGEHLAAFAGYHAVVSEDRGHAGKIDSFGDRVAFSDGFRAKAFRALAKVLDLEALAGKNFGQSGPPPTAFAHLAIEAEPASEKDGVDTARLNGLHGQADAVRKGEDFGAEEVTVEELWMQLEVLRLDVRENDHVVFLEDLFVFARRHVVEIPSRHALDLVSAGFLGGSDQPLAVVDEVQALGGVVERGLRIDRSQLDRPVADVVDSCHN